MNSVVGMVAHGITVAELADYRSDPLGAPLPDSTNLAAPCDLTIDFTPCVDQEHNDLRPDPTAVRKAALKGHLGLEVVGRKQPLDLFIIDQVDVPTPN